MNIEPMNIEPMNFRALAWLRHELEDESITVDHNFLDVGGNSFLAMKLAELLFVEDKFPLDTKLLFESSLGNAFSHPLPSS